VAVLPLCRMVSRSHGVTLGTIAAAVFVLGRAAGGVLSWGSVRPG